MMSDKVSPARLHQLLDDLGFSRRRVPGSHFVFRHPPSDTLILLPEQENGFVPRTQVVAVRRMLIEKGLVEPDDFDRWVLQIPSSS